MRIAIIAGPDPGHALPAITLARKLGERGHHSIVFTGKEWEVVSASRCWDYALLPGLAPRPEDDDLDAGAKLHQRAGYMAKLLAPLLRESGCECVISDVITAAGGLAAQLVDIPWAELHPHPLYYNSRYFPPVGSGLSPGKTVWGKMRDATLRYMTQRAVKIGQLQRQSVREELGLSFYDPEPQVKLVATFPQLENIAPDWPENAFIIGPLVDEPVDHDFPIPSGEGPLIVVSPSTAFTAVPELLPKISRAFHPDNYAEPVRLAVCSFHPEQINIPFGVVGFGRQDVLLRQADVAIGGGGHGFLAKTLLAHVPSVLVPGGGDQWEIAQRAARLGCSEVVRPLTVSALVAAVHKVYKSPSYAVRAAQVGSLHNIYDPVDIVENYLCN